GDEHPAMLPTLVKRVQDEEVMTTLLKAQETGDVLSAIEHFSKNN
ncbi:PTS sugar transporter subunit IIA, partial [Escherichia coli]|nr:PTS sugar transporter subunit IIA [Escherichia coli]